MERLCYSGRDIRFKEVSNTQIADLNQQWEILRQRLEQGLKTSTPIYRVQFTPANAPLKVIRLVVPLLEHYTEQSMRVGKRLAVAIETQESLEKSGCVEQQCANG